VTRRIALLFAAVALATAAMGRAQDRSKPGGEAAAGGESRREAFRIVDAYVVSNLQESLGLTDAEFVKVLPLVQKLQTSRREYLLARGRLLHQLRRQLGSGSADEAEVRQTLDELKKTEATGPERTRAALAELDAALGPLQQAKFRVLELDVEQRLRELMGRARARGAGARPPRE
jgi:Spy/CpxP family protein refolding chaperone